VAARKGVIRINFFGRAHFPAKAGPDLGPGAGRVSSEKNKKSHQVGTHAATTRCDNSRLGLINDGDAPTRRPRHADLTR
jgi:hypothetical protein